MAAIARAPGDVGGSSDRFLAFNWPGYHPVVDGGLRRLMVVVSGFGHELGLALAQSELQTPLERLGIIPCGGHLERDVVREGVGEDGEGEDVGRAFFPCALGCGVHTEDDQAERDRRDFWSLGGMLVRMRKAGDMGKLTMLEKQASAGFFVARRIT